jgi:hypothetical protein
MTTVPVPKYNENLRAEVETAVGDAPKAAVHRTEWAKVLAGAAHAGCALLPSPCVRARGRGGIGRADPGFGCLDPRTPRCALRAAPHPAPLACPPVAAPR